MSIDEELAKAVEEGPPRIPTRIAHRHRSNPQKPKRNVRLLVGLIVIAVVVLALLPLTFEGSAVWATTVDQLIADKALQGRRVRVVGTLVRGSLMKRDQPCEFRFRIRTNESVVLVRYAQCVIPDTLQDRPEADVEVTAEGTLQPDGTFEATQILAKCPSKYEEKGGKVVPAGELELK